MTFGVRYNVIHNWRAFCAPWYAYLAVAWLFEARQRLGGHFLCQTLLNSGRPPRRCLRR